jgi:Protein of unknown function (DUF3800)
MEDERLHIYVDESGTPNLTEEGEHPDYYVIVALLISDSNFSDCEASAKEIVSNYAGEGELKSSSVGNNTDRRKRILTDIKNADFRYYSLVVNKSEVWRESGLQYKQVFYKFLHRMFYSRIKRNFSGLSIVADQYGDSDFMEKFKSYLFGFNNLFDSIDFQPSSELPLLQIADIISGTIRRIYDKSDPVELFEIINYPSVPIEEWPPNFSKEINISALEANEKFDEFIRMTSLNSAKVFIEKYLGSENSELNEQALAVRYLLYRYFENSSDYVYRIEIAKYLNLVADVSYSEHQISSNIISKIREAGVIIASTERGIKIPYSYNDIYEWITRVDSQVVPYLKRVEYARDEFLIASQNEYDIIDHDRFPDLGAFLTNKKQIE